MCIKITFEQFIVVSKDMIIKTNHLEASYINEIKNYASFNGVAIFCKTCYIHPRSNELVFLTKKMTEDLNKHIFGHVPFDKFRYKD